MKVWGLSPSKLEEVERSYGLKLNNFRQSGKAYQFRIGVVPGTPRRKSAGGRVVQSPTFARMIMTLITFFGLGADRVQSGSGNWKSAQELVVDLDTIASQNIGSQMSPAYLGDKEFNQPDPEMENALRKITG